MSVESMASSSDKGERGAQEGPALPDEEMDGLVAVLEEERGRVQTAPPRWPTIADHASRLSRHPRSAHRDRRTLFPRPRIPEAPRSPSQIGTDQRTAWVASRPACPFERIEGFRQ